MKNYFIRITHNDHLNSEKLACVGLILPNFWKS